MRRINCPLFECEFRANLFENLAVQGLNEYSMAIEYEIKRQLFLIPGCGAKTVRFFNRDMVWHSWHHVSRTKETSAVCSAPGRDHDRK